jgi:hypothetical protein
MPSIDLYPPDINFNQDPMFLQFSTSSTEENLSGYVQVHAKYDDEGSTEHFLVELEPNYGFDGSAVVNLSGLMPFRMSPPADNSILAGAIQSGLLGRVSGELRASYADQYGTPKVIQSITAGAWVKVVDGASEYWNGFNGRTEAAVLLNSLSSYRRSSTKNSIIKEIMPGQPEYISFYAASATSITITANILTADGTLHANHACGTVSLVKGCNWVSVNLQQLGILTAYPTAVKYRLNITGGWVITYQIITNEPEYNIFLLMDTGTGGVETVKVAGQKEYSTTTSSIEVERMMWLGSSHRDGLIDRIHKQGQKEIKCNSGYYTREYVEHLAQLLYGRIWLIDTVRHKFLAYNTISTEITESADNSDLYNCEFTIQQAWKSYNHSTFNQ